VQRATPRRFSVRHETTGVARAAWHNRAIELELLNLESPSEVRTFDKGRFEIYRIGPMTLGRATYEPAGAGPSMSGASAARARA